MLVKHTNSVLLCVQHSDGPNNHDPSLASEKPTVIYRESGTEHVEETTTKKLLFATGIIFKEKQISMKKDNPWLARRANAGFVFTGIITPVQDYDFRAYVPHQGVYDSFFFSAAAGG